ncbi:MAG: hypothetical protein KY469_02605 [Actinobacteria bacterium]|nr:hypothetical protein [Actinomycetota bacterium]
MTRVLYAPRNISGQASEYAAAVAPHGFAGEIWSYGDVAYGFSADRIIDKVRLRTDPAFRFEVLHEAVTRFDVFHFQYGRSLLDPVGAVLPDLWDLPLLRSLGKKVFMHWRGSDIRLPSEHRTREPDSYFNDVDLEVDEDRVRGRISICRRYCDAMFVSTPGLLDYVPDADWVPHVIDTQEWAYVDRVEPDVPLVVHIPSNRGIKGSHHVETAVAPLVEQGLIRYQTLNGLDRVSLRGALERADIVVDSITIGDHGLISVEAMSLGAIPVAHIHPQNRERNPGVPVVEAQPATLEQVLRDLARDRDRRADLRMVVRAWAENRHDRRTVAPLLVGAYRRRSAPVVAAYPDWPRSAAQVNLAALEDEIERLRTSVDPVVGSLSLFTTGSTRFAVDRLLARIVELEAAVEARQPRSRLLRRRQLRRTFREFVKRHPVLHRWARRVSRIVGG